jgi:hypothetical protein
VPQCAAFHFHTTFAADLVVTHALEWPSLTVQWLPVCASAVSAAEHQRGSTSTGSMYTIANLSLPSDAKNQAILSVLSHHLHSLTTLRMPFEIAG